MATSLSEFRRRINLHKKQHSSAKQHRRGKLGVYERIELLVDEGSFVELQAMATLRSHDLQLQRKKTIGDGVVTGFASVDGRRVYLYAQDVTQIGGSLGEIHARKISAVYAQALQTGCPIIGLIDSGGARIQEGLGSLDGYATIFRQAVEASGVIPQISVILGSAAGGAAYLPALNDIVIMVKEQTYMFITGPQVVKAATGEEVDFNRLGGSHAHSHESGVAHFVATSEEAALARVRSVLAYLPDNYLNAAPSQSQSVAHSQAAQVGECVPADPTRTYDMAKVIERVLDRDSFIQWQRYFAPNVLIGFGRLEGQVVGIVANQSQHLAGCLDIHGSEKIARFVNFCDAFNLPLINFVDIPGYLPGVDQEHQGIIRYGAKVLHAYARATVPKLALIVRKAYGGGYIALASKSLGYDRVIAWPQAELAVMGAEQAVDIIYHKELEGVSPKECSAKRKQLIEQYQRQFMHPYHAAEMGQVDEIIEPSVTRETLSAHLKSLVGKREIRFERKRTNPPV